MFAQRGRRLPTQIEITLNHRGEFRLTVLKGAFIVAPLTAGHKTAMRICSITKARPTKGSVIHRRGLAKKKGGIGQHVTKVVPRTFAPNLRTRRLWVSELNRYVTVKLTARALKTANKNGVFNTLKKAGIV